MLEHRLLYTAITRARKLVVLVGTKRAVAMAVRRVTSHAIVTTLREPLAGETATMSGREVGTKTQASGKG